MRALWGHVACGLPSTLSVTSLGPPFAPRSVTMTVTGGWLVGWCWSFGQRSPCSDPCMMRPECSAEHNGVPALRRLPPGIRTMERGELRPVFVSRGIGYSGLNLRLHCPAEVALLALRATVPICGLLIQRDHNS